MDVHKQIKLEAQENCSFVRKCLNQSSPTITTLQQLQLKSIPKGDFFQNIAE